MPDAIVDARGAPVAGTHVAPSVSSGSLAVDFHVSLFLLARAIMAQESGPGPRWLVLTTGVFNVTGDEKREPERALIAGTLDWIACQSIGASAELCEIAGAASEEEVADCAIERLRTAGARGTSRRCSFRGRHRWVQTFEEIEPIRGDLAPEFGRAGGVYGLTGWPSPT